MEGRTKRVDWHRKIASAAAVQHQRIQSEVQAGSSHHRQADASTHALTRIQMHTYTQIVIYIVQFLYAFMPIHVHVMHT